MNIEDLTTEELFSLKEKVESTIEEKRELIVPELEEQIAKYVEEATKSLEQAMKLANVANLDFSFNPGAGCDTINYYGGDKEWYNSSMSC